MSIPNLGRLPLNPPQRDRVADRRPAAAAGGSIAGVTKAVAIQATQKGKLMVDRAREAREKPATVYFYMAPGGVPQGPLSLSDIKARIADGTLAETVRVAEPGSSDWKTVAEVSHAPVEEAPL